MSEPSCGNKFCNGCSKPKAEEPKHEEHPKSCESCHKHEEHPEPCHKHVKRKPKSSKTCDCESCCHRKEKVPLTEQQRFMISHEPEAWKVAPVSSDICRDKHCKDHAKKLIIKPSSIDANVPQMMPMMIPPQMPPMGYLQPPPLYHPNRPMYRPPPPPPPPQYSTYDRPMPMYRSPYGGGYRDNFW